MAVGLACCGARPPPLWIADQVRNDVTMRGIVFILCSQCQALGQALILSHQGRGGIWLCCLVHPHL